MATVEVRSIAVTSGKGGVGKSCIALNLAICLARSQQRVLLLDADWGLGGIAILAGLKPRRTIEDVLLGECAMEEAVIDGPDGLVVLPAAIQSDLCWEQITPAHIAAIDPLIFWADFDLVVIDTGAGIAPRVMDFAAAADETLIVTTPESTAVADAYAALKMLVQREPTTRSGLLVNMADTAGEAEDVHANFSELATRFLGAEIDNRGYIPTDRFMRQAVKCQIPLALAQPPPPAADALAQLAGNLLTGRVIPMLRSEFFTRLLKQKRLSSQVARI